MASTVAAPSSFVAAVASQAVSRSSELLACARTAMRLLQYEQGKLSSINQVNSPLTELQLYSYPIPSDQLLHHTEAIYHMLSPVQRAINEASQILRKS